MKPFAFLVKSILIIELYKSRIRLRINVIFKNFTVKPVASTTLLGRPKKKTVNDGL